MEEKNLTEVMTVCDNKGIRIFINELDILQKNSRDHISSLVKKVAIALYEVPFIDASSKYGLDLYSSHF